MTRVGEALIKKTTADIHADIPDGVPFYIIPTDMVNWLPSCAIQPDTLFSGLRVDKPTDFLLIVNMIQYISLAACNQFSMFLISNVISILSRDHKFNLECALYTTKLPVFESRSTYRLFNSFAIVYHVGKKE